jgi:signal transduction histidine kinase
VPAVTIGAEALDGRIRLWVADRGIGIAAEHQKRIFEVFQRLHGSAEYPGTGIGLAIVKKGVERLGGRVGVESASGEGSRFWIELAKGDRE